MKSIISPTIWGRLGDYWISISGDVLSFKGVNPRLRKPQKHSAGYRQLTLTLNGVSGWYLIHRLVGIVFITNPDNLPQINHLDEDPANNWIENLEWSSNRDNTIYSQIRKGVSCVRDYKRT